MNDRIKRTGIFVMSCDKTADVAKHFVAAFKKYWPDCPLPVFFGVNTQTTHLEGSAFQPLTTPVSGWKEETLYQLNLIRSMSPGITNLIVFLDDFILNRTVDTERMQLLIDDIAAERIAYLRLKHLEESWIIRLQQYLLPVVKLGKEKCFKMRPSHPYYSSLQVACWEIGHLIDFVSKCDNIWAFEHLQDLSKPHYSVLHTIFYYRHVVEKGKWETGAAEYCRKAIGWFEAGNRKMNSDSISVKIKFATRKIIFFFFGFSIMRLKKNLRAS